jgi:hypothetical protein
MEYEVISPLTVVFVGDGCFRRAVLSTWIVVVNQVPPGLVEPN